MNMPKDTYSHLDLCEFKNLLSLSNQLPNKEILEFQNVFKSSFLSPTTWPGSDFSSLSPFRQNKINAMYLKIIESKALKRVLLSPQTFVSFDFTLEGRNCCYLADLIFSETVFSFKVTNEVDLPGFSESVLLNNYHLEAGFSYEATGLRNFILVGVQHFHPYDLFVVDLSKWDGPGGLSSGHHECKCLLRQIGDSKFVPTSWNH